MTSLWEGKQGSKERSIPDACLFSTFSGFFFRRICPIESAHLYALLHIALFWGYIYQLISLQCSRFKVNVTVLSSVVLIWFVTDITLWHSWLLWHFPLVQNGISMLWLFFCIGSIHMYLANSVYRLVNGMRPRLRLRQCAVTTAVIWYTQHIIYPVSFEMMHI